MLINRDAQPKAMLFSLLLALRQTTLLSFARHVPILWAGGIWMAACPIVVYGLLRVVYLLAPRGRRGSQESIVAAAAVDGRVLIFATGLAGMALSIVLMLLYQSRFGSLFLHIGLISSLFMLGSFLGSLLSDRLLASKLLVAEFPRIRGVGEDHREPRLLLPCCLLANLAFVALLLVLPDSAARTVYALLFALCGLFVGVYFPLGAHRLRAAGHSAPAAGASLEMLDHLGGAAGAMLSGWLLLPLLGTLATLGVIGLLVGVNLLPVFVLPRTDNLLANADWFDRLVRPVGYVLLGVAASALAMSHIAAATQAEQAGQRVVEAARTLTGRDNLVSQTATRADGGTVTYWLVPDSADQEGGYVFSTESLAGNISGYGGPIAMAVFVGRDGTLRGLQIVHSRETPAYVESLRGWLKALPGHNVFQPGGLNGVDAVSGATMTSDAVLRSLQQAGPQFASAALGMNVQAAAPAARHRIDPQFVCLFVLLAAAVVLRRIPRVGIRRAMLLATLLLTGFWWNLQYSSQQVVAILSFSLPGNWLSGSFFLVLLVPVIVLLVGNVYCGYVCPFGALQELVGDLRPRRMETDPNKSVWRYGRMVKYVLLTLLIVLFALTRRYDVLSADPLLTVFSSLRDRWALWLGLGLITLSFSFRRFWCRNLCPAGAFLALLGGARLLRRLMPRTAPGRCDLGVRTPGELDCLFCDRCKHAQD
jgi:Na+-translocating ferredoxin:NAD+ oxidoreductase RnfG subunit